MVDIVQDSTVTLETYWLSRRTGQPYDPTTQSLTIKNPAGSTVVTKTEADLTKLGTGHYVYDYDTASDAPKGTWSVIWKGSAPDDVLTGTFDVV